VVDPQKKLDEKVGKAEFSGFRRFVAGRLTASSLLSSGLAWVCRPGIEPRGRRLRR
jgi:hypothetical protein